MNTGGWLLLTAIFGGLMLLVQRSERNRRLVTALVLAFVALIVWRYAIFRMSTDCDLNPIFARLCSFNWVRQRTTAIAINTVNLSLITAFFLNLFFWVFIGRSNPPGSSDSIKVLGMND